MSSLVQIAKPSRPLSPSVSSGPAVFQRFKACSVFSQLGLSRRLAGEELFARVQEVCQKQVEQEQGTDPTETGTLSTSMIFLSKVFYKLKRNCHSTNVQVKILGFLVDDCILHWDFFPWRFPFHKCLRESWNPQRLLISDICGMTIRTRSN